MDADIPMKSRHPWKGALGTLELCPRQRTATLKLGVAKE